MTPFQTYQARRFKKERLEAILVHYLLEKRKDGLPFIDSYKVISGKENEEHIFTFEPKITLPNQYIITELKVNIERVEVKMYTSSGDLVNYEIPIDVAEVLEDLKTLLLYSYTLSQKLEF